MSLHQHSRPSVVWVLEPCGYDEYGIEGVFATAEAAKAFYPEWEWEEKDGQWYTPGAGAMSSGFRVYPAEVRL